MSSVKQTAKCAALFALLVAWRWYDSGNSRKFRGRTHDIGGAG